MELQFFDIDFLFVASNEYYSVYIEIPLFWFVAIIDADFFPFPNFELYFPIAKNQVSLLDFNWRILCVW